MDTAIVLYLLRVEDASAVVKEKAEEGQEELLDYPQELLLDCFLLAGLSEVRWLNFIQDSFIYTMDESKSI